MRPEMLLGSGLRIFFLCRARSFLLTSFPEAHATADQLFGLFERHITRRKFVIAITTDAEELRNPERILRANGFHGLIHRFSDRHDPAVAAGFKIVFLVESLAGVLDGDGRDSAQDAHAITESQFFLPIVVS